MELTEKLSELKTEEKTFQINSFLNKARSIEIEKLKIYKNKIYVYVVENSIKVYNCNTFKEISNLKLPFNREVDESIVHREFITVEILENGIVLILADKKLYFYEIILKENKLKFLQYLSEVHHFCYLEKKKEIFLLTESELVGDYYGMAKSDLLGNIIFRNKEKKPQIYYEFKSPNKVSGLTIFALGCSRTPIHFSQFDSFNNDIYIINIYGITDNYYYYYNLGPRDEQYNISIYNSDNLKEIYNKDYNVDLRYGKITDIYFKKCYDDFSFFYYNDKTNTINFITNITNMIYKSFNMLCNEEKEKSVDEEEEKSDDEEVNEDEEEEGEDYFDIDNIKKDAEYFYLKDNMFGLFNGNFLFIIDLSSNKIMKKIEIKNKDNEKMEIKNLIYVKQNGNEYLYMTSFVYNRECGDGSKIIRGILL